MLYKLDYGTKIKLTEAVIQSVTLHSVNQDKKILVHCKIRTDPVPKYVQDVIKAKGSHISF